MREKQNQEIKKNTIDKLKQRTLRSFDLSSVDKGKKVDISWSSPPLSFIFLSTEGKSRVFLSLKNNIRY